MLNAHSLEVKLTSSSGKTAAALVESALRRFVTNFSISSQRAKAIQQFYNTLNESTVHAWNSGKVYVNVDASGSQSTAQRQKTIKLQLRLDTTINRLYV